VAYVTDPLFSDMMSRGRDVETNGLAGLLACPRAPAGARRAYTAHRLYEVDFSGASDISGVEASPATIHRCARRCSGTGCLNINYEGIALAPRSPTARAVC
jgi:hypothetical protein